MREVNMMPTQSIQSMKYAVESARQVCLFGVGALLMECYGQLVLSLGREPDLLCDNDSRKWGKEFLGKQCISPRELVDLRDGMVFIITVRKYESIFEQLHELGISNIFVARFDSCYHALCGINKLDDDQATLANEHVSSLVNLIGKWTLVTGASRGIGKQIAMAMAKLGSNIIAHSRSISHVADVTQACQEYGVEVVPIAAELANIDEVEAMLIQLEQCVPHIDIVFNNAGIHRGGPWPSEIWSIDGNIYRECFAVNATASILICQKLIPPMIKRGFGRVVYIHTNLRNTPHEIPYVCSKAAMDMYVLDIAPHLNETGVMMSLVDPGLVNTDPNASPEAKPVESVIPGILLGAIVDANINGCRFSAQEYTGMSIEASVNRAHKQLRQSGSWI